MTIIEMKILDRMFHVYEFITYDEEGLGYSVGCKKAYDFLEVGDTYTEPTDKYKNIGDCVQALYERVTRL